MYLRLAASIRGNILRWDGLCENVHGIYSYYHPVGVTASSIGAASYQPTNLLGRTAYIVLNGALTRAADTATLAIVSLMF